MKVYIYIIIEVTYDYYRFTENLAVATSQQRAEELAKQIAKERLNPYVEEAVDKAVENEDYPPYSVYITVQSMEVED